MNVQSKPSQAPLLCPTSLWSIWATSVRNFPLPERGDTEDSHQLIWSGPEIENRQQPTDVVLGQHSVFEIFKLGANF